MKKKSSLTLRQKLIFAFSAMIILLCTNAFVGISINRSSKNISENINKIYKPLSDGLQSLDELQNSSVILAKQWIENYKLEDKQALKKIVQIEYPQNRLFLGRFIPELNVDDLSLKINGIVDKYDIVISYEKEMMNMLTSQADYENNDRISYCRNLLNKNIIPVSTSNTEILNTIILDVRQIIQNLENIIIRKTFVYNLFTYVITGLLILMIIWLIFMLPGILFNKIISINKSIDAMKKGELPNMFSNTTNDEIGEIENGLNELNTKLEGIKTFAIEMGKGNIKANVKVINEWGNIGVALNEMKVSLEEIAAIQEKQRKEEELNNWISSGIAHFNEILRIKNNDIDELSYEIVKELVKYIGAVIGGVYISKKDHDNNDKLKMSGLFAYERKRFVETEIQPGEGLIGTSYVEKHKIYMREIPDDYVKISSGLGEASPNELLIVPLLHNERIHGVLELATLDVFPEHVITFVERIAEGLASTISSVVINSETARLLEESNEKAERLHSQEEELRQNMEELQASQEERERQAKEVEAIHKNLEEIIMNIPVPVFVKDEKGDYLIVNKEQERLLNKTKDELIGKNDNDFILDAAEMEIILNSDTEVLKNNKRIELPNQMMTMPDGSIKKVKTIKIPILNNISCQLNILGISYYM